MTSDIPHMWPFGSDCPLGSSSPVLCPIGTYNPLQQRTSSNECLKCCCLEESIVVFAVEIHQEVDVQQDSLGSSVSTPHDSDPFHVSYVGETCVGVNKTAINDVCPPGHYCSEGSSSPIQCPPGTNSSAGWVCLLNLIVLLVLV